MANALPVSPQPVQPLVLADLVSRTLIAQVALVLGGALFVGISAQIAVPLPFTPVPLTMQTFAVLLTGAALGSVRGVLALVTYAAAGAAGVPWFSQGTSGVAWPSFGYIIGFIAAAFIVGRLAESGSTRSVVRTAGLMALGTIVIYAVGFSWLKFATGLSWGEALMLGVAPFIIADALKIALASALLPATWAGLKKLGLR